MLAFVVDDDAGNRLLVSNHLRNLGYKVVQFADDEEVLVVVPAVKPALLVATIASRCDDRINVIGDIKRLYRDCRIVAVMPARDADETSGLLEELGVDAALIGPVNAPGLRRAIRHLERKTQAEGAR